MRIVRPISAVCPAAVGVQWRRTAMPSGEIDATVHQRRSPGHNVQLCNAKLLPADSRRRVPGLGRLRQRHGVPTGTRPRALSRPGGGGRFLGFLVQTLPPIDPLAEPPARALWRSGTGRSLVSTSTPNAPTPIVSCSARTHRIRRAYSTRRASSRRQFRVKAMPSTFVFDRDGKLVSTSSAFARSMRSEHEAEIEKLCL